MDDDGDRMTLQGLAIQRLIKKDGIAKIDIRSLDCGIVRNILISIDKGRISLKPDEIILFLKKLVEELPCKGFRDVFELITYLYSKYDPKLLMIPHDLGILKERLSTLPLDIIYTKEEVITTIKNLQTIFPEYLMDVGGLILLKHLNYDKFLLVGQPVDQGMTREIDIELFLSVTPLRERGERPENDRRQTSIKFITSGYTGESMFAIMNKYTPEENRELFAFMNEERPVLILD